jgi:hypothetical protein
MLLGGPRMGELLVSSMVSSYMVCSLPLNRDQKADVQRATTIVSW